MRVMKVQQRGLVHGLLALVVAAACGSDSSVGTLSATPSPTAQTSSTPTPQPSVTPTPQPSGTPTGQPTPGPPSPTPHLVLDTRFGFLVYKAYASDPTPGPIGWKVQREGDSSPSYTLRSGTSYAMNVSPEGRRLAYWSGKELRVIDVARWALPRTLLTLSSKESSLYMAWSSDGTGVVIGVTGGAPAFADALPGYTAIRVVNAAGGGLREIIRVPSSNILPLSWDRQAQLITAYEPFCCSIANYDTIKEEGTIHRTTPGLEIHSMQASKDAKYVFGRNNVDSPPFGKTTILRVWPSASIAAGVDLSSIGGEPILAAEWRPGTAEIGVLFTDRLEFWTASGTRRSVALPAFPAQPAKALLRFGLRFRADGTAAIIDRAYESGTNGSYSDGAAVAIDLATGVIEDLDWTGPPNPGPGTPIRLDTAQ